MHFHHADPAIQGAGDLLDGAALCRQPQLASEIVTIEPLGNEPEFWLALEASYDLAMLRANLGAKIEAEVEIAA